MTFDTDKPEVLVRVPYPDTGLDLLRRHFVVHYVPDPAELERQMEEFSVRVRAVVTNGTAGRSANHMARLKRLEAIVARGAGYEAIDLDAARAGGIAVAISPAVNSFAVADHAMALILALLRDIRNADLAVRSGEWDIRDGGRKSSARRIDRCRP